MPALRVLVPATAFAVLAAGQTVYAVAGIGGATLGAAAARPLVGSQADSGPGAGGSGAGGSGAGGSGEPAVDRGAATAPRAVRPKERRHPAVSLPVVAGTPVSSEFSPDRDGKVHAGMDFNGDEGDPIFAATNGRVTYAQFNSGGYGNLIMIRRNDGTQTWYAHLSTIGVRVGQWVWAGERIGRMGNTGDSTGSHLHFEVRVGSAPTPTNPRRLLFGKNRGYPAPPPSWACARWGC